MSFHPFVLLLLHDLVTPSTAHFADVENGITLGSRYAEISHLVLNCNRRRRVTGSDSQLITHTHNQVLHLVLNCKKHGRVTGPDSQLISHIHIHTYILTHTYIPTSNCTSSGIWKRRLISALNTRCPWSPGRTCEQKSKHNVPTWRLYSAILRVTLIHTSARRYKVNK